ncbi:hypothetical protein D3C87_260440 [compost metagenome]
MPQFKGGIRILKIALSLWAVYQIFVIMVMPNLGSYLGRSALPFVSPYASALGFNASWNFFSPDPAHTMYIRYMVRYDDVNNMQDSDKEPVQGYFPREKNKGIADMTRQRELYIMRFMIIAPKRLQYLMGPWLCRQYPGATSLELEHVIETVAPLDEAVTFRDENIRDLSRELQVIRTDYSCSGQDLDEVEIQ